MSHYFDYSATSPLLPAARTAMIEAMDLSVAGELGNASSLHSAGRRAHEIIETARAAIAHLINADPDEIIFTSGGSEANNTVMHIFEGQNIVTSPIEHPSILNAVNNATGDAKLYSYMLANNETGNLLDLPHHPHTYLHTDATQALGKIPIDVKALGIDYLTASAHKIGGPTGIGILYVKHGSPYTPLIRGGHQEHGRRAGTSPVINIAGFGAAADFASSHHTWELYEQNIRPLRDQLTERILADIPHSSLNTDIAHSLPNILNASFKAAEGESIQLYLDLEGNIQVSTGSACASGDGKPSHVLMAMTGDAEIAHSSIRFSFGLDTTQADIDYIMSHLPRIVKKLQGISTIKL